MKHFLVLLCLFAIAPTTKALADRGLVQLRQWGVSDDVIEQAREMAKN